MKRKIREILVVLLCSLAPIPIIVGVVQSKPLEPIEDKRIIVGESQVATVIRPPIMIEQSGIYRIALETTPSNRFLAITTDDVVVGDSVTYYAVRNISWELVMFAEKNQ